MPNPVVPVVPDITVVDRVDEETVEDFNRLIPQLHKNSPPLDAARLAQVLDCPSNLVLAARIGTRTVGLLTLVILTLPTGVCARLEDVVVDEPARGRGAGLALVRAALAAARSRGAVQVDLTSRPSRTAAHRLYEKAGFARRETNVYRYRLDIA
ncbi:GNAT family N-acetyltransferase [Kitasatospora sp. NPDC058162]|uniref:GNAT family N-acetyltransferase n=1 Tax=Kitasatospora sp. NPDC058162 TaxID=3346362 RepID=UPI0036DA171A